MQRFTRQHDYSVRHAMACEEGMMAASYSPSSKHDQGVISCSERLADRDDVPFGKMEDDDAVHPSSVVEIDRQID